MMWILLSAMGALSILVCVVIQRRYQTCVHELHQKQHALIHVLEEGVLVLNDAYEGVDCNRAFCRILGCRAEQLIGQEFLSLSGVLYEEVLEKSQYLLKQAYEIPSGVRDNLCYSKSGEACALDMMALRMQPRGLVLILKDTSHDYQIFKMGKDFIANASHELRTPITIIKGFIETLQDLPEVSDAMLEDIFEKILRSCTRMDDIVKNLLILTDLDHSFKTNIHPVDLVALLDNCRHSLLEIYPDIKVDMVCSIHESKQEVDSSLLELAIMNLLQNAVKYSPAPAHIEIHLKESHEECLISIADHGYGIPYENRPYIFNRFYSVNKTVSRKLGGAGLGLSIVKNIVEKHHGSIRVEDNPLGGTIFTLALPQM